MSDLASYIRSWHKWYWVLVPALTVAAYLSVLRIGFLADDFTQLNLGHIWGLNPFMSMAGDNPGFLRPIGFFLTYQMGWYLWGYDPLPYHIVALLVHAASALLLGLWLAAVTRKASLGWLAGVLFGVSPLHLEAVGWVAAQFDTFAVFFGLASLLCFTQWWLSPGRSRWGLYFLSLVLYTLAIFTKESFLAFVPIYLLSAWFSSSPVTTKECLKLGGAVFTFLLPVGLNLGYRYVRWGTLGGYSETHAGYGYPWDNLLVYARMLLSPLNESVVGSVWVQVTYLFSIMGLLVLVILYGAHLRRLLLLVGAWLLVTIPPVLGLMVTASDIEQGYLPTKALIVPSSATDMLLQNRYLYLVSAGVMAGVAGLLHTALSLAKRTRFALVALVALLILSSTAACWVQLRPWHTATVQTEELIAELLRIVPAYSRPNGMVWYVDGIPTLYKGVYLLFTGLGISRIFHNGEIDYPQIQKTPDITQALSTHLDDQRDTYAIRIGYDVNADRFVVDYAAGITSDNEPPGASDAGDNVQIWDFRSCDADVLGKWEVIQAQAICAKGKGLSVLPSGDDPQLLSKSLAIGPGSAGADYVRMRVSVSYAKNVNTPAKVSEWFWSDTRHEFAPERRINNPIKQDGRPLT